MDGQSNGLISAGRDVAEILKEKYPDKEVYFVGGMVRNYLMEKAIKDVDVAGNIHPSLVAELFPGSTVTEKLGTVFIRREGGDVEYTPYRVEGDYNGRHPGEVKFSQDVREDMKRRDFTINALYMNPFTLEVLDLVGGLGDIRNKVLRCVGDPVERFQEDYLRILRAIRFSVQFGLEIDPATLSALHEKKEHLSRLSGFRLREELLKGVGVPGYVRRSCELGVMEQVIPEVADMRGVDQKTVHHKYDVLEHSLRSLEYAVDHHKGRAPEFYLAVFLHDIGKPAQYSEIRRHEHGSEGFRKTMSLYDHSLWGAKIVEHRLSKLHFSAKEIDYVSMMVRLHKNGSLYEENVNLVKDKTIKKLMAESGHHMDDLIVLAIADRYGTGTRTMEEVREWADAFSKRVADIEARGEPGGLKDLALNGHDVMSLGFGGRDVGLLLNALHEHVLEKPEDNTRERLIALVPEFRNKTGR
ncbi:MAG: CCA tRNA nucleotidyltransferase [Nitrospinae bacterium]|nr:CCA tRNA nucleotidyltransferase [Nitrospinota bacterium]